MYAILHAPRGDATEAIVLVAGWLNVDGELNQSGVAIVLTLARYFKSEIDAVVINESLLTVRLYRMVAVVKGYHFPHHRR